MGGPATTPRGRPDRRRRIAAAGAGRARPRGARTRRGRAGQQRRREPASRVRVRGAGGGDHRPERRPVRGRHRRRRVGCRDRRRARRAGRRVRRDRSSAAHGRTDHEAPDFDAAADQLAAAARDAGPVDAVIVALVGDGARADATSPDVDGWQRVLDEHAGITDGIRTDAAWVRAVADHAAASDRPVRIVTVVDATSAGGRSRAQAAAQLSRAAHSATSDRVDAFAISVEAAGRIGARSDRRGRGVPGERRRHAARCPGPSSSSSSEWLGLRSHPRPAGTVSFGGPDVPAWLDGALRDMVGAGSAELRDKEG